MMNQGMEHGRQGQDMDKRMQEMHQQGGDHSRMRPGMVGPSTSQQSSQTAPAPTR